MPNALEPINKLAEFTFEGGYISSAAKQLGTGHLAKGSENVMLTGTGKTQNFKGVTRRVNQGGGGVMQNVVETFASIGIATEPTKFGSIFNVFAALFYIGAGTIRLAGELISPEVEATSTLSLVIKRNGSYADPESGPFGAGLPIPSAPIIRAVEPTAGLTGKVNGVVSVVIWRVRSSTGARSIKSLVSNLVGATNNAIAIPFPSASEEGQDFWGIGVTRHGEGAVGSHFILREISEADVAASEVDGQERTVAVEWRDGDLTEFAPTRDYPPPAGLYAGSLEDVVFVDGTYSDAFEGVGDTLGSGIAPSEPGRPESFSPDTVVFTNDTPTALIRGDGLYWRFGRNSLSVIRYVGGLRPLSVEPVWNGTGIEHQNQAVIGDGGRLYVWNEVPLRMGANGMPDSEFANDVADDLAACTNSAKKVMGWDGRHKVICFCYEKKIFPYFTALGRWGSPLNLTGKIVGNIQSCVTENNKLLISTKDATTDYLYEFNVGNGTIMQVMTGWVAARASIDTVHSVMCSVRADNTAHPVVIEVFADGDDTDSVSSDSLTPPRTGYQALVPIRPNVQDCTSFAVRLTIRSTTPTGDVGIETVSVHGEGSSIML